MMEHTSLVITSQVVHGRVGGRGVVFALERLGVPCAFLPTITLPWHPGHGTATKIVADSLDFQNLINDLKSAPWLKNLGAVITGYMGDSYQVAVVAELIKKIKAQNPDCLYLCDPVLGDRNSLYIGEDIAVSIRDDLLPLADIITPNLFEFNWLMQKDHKSNEALYETARVLPHKITVVTSSFAMMKNSKAVFLYDNQEEKAVLSEHQGFENVPHGTGDLFSGLFLARLLSGQPSIKALELSCSALFEIIAQTMKRGNKELLLVEEQLRLERPMAMVNLRQISGLTSKKVRFVPKSLS